MGMRGRFGRIDRAERGWVWSAMKRYRRCVGVCGVGRTPGE